MLLTNSFPSSNFWPFEYPVQLHPEKFEKVFQINKKCDQEEILAIPGILCIIDLQNTELGLTHQIQPTLMFRNLVLKKPTWKDFNLRVTKAGYRRISSVHLKVFTPPIY